MRVTAPRPSIGLRLFQYGDQPCQRGRVETRRYCNTPPASQFNQQPVVLLCVGCGLLDKLDPRQWQLHSTEGPAHRRGRKRIVMACMLAIPGESRQRQAMLTTELCSTQPTLRIRRHDLRHLRTAATTETMNCRDRIFTHAFSESSSKAYGKNGLGRRNTMCPPFPTRSAMTQCSSLCCISSARNAVNSARRDPQPRRIAHVA